MRRGYVVLTNVGESGTRPAVRPLTLTIIMVTATLISSEVEMCIKKVKKLTYFSQIQYDNFSVQKRCSFGCTSMK